MKRAFTLIEIIAVLVIFAIVASIGSDILFNAYQNYLLSKSTDTVYYKVEYALDTIEARLRDKIPFTCIRRKGTQGSDFDTLITLHDNKSNYEDYKVLECVLSAQEARRANAKDLGWSGFIDLSDPETNKTKRTIATPGSKLSLAKDIILALSQNDCDLSRTNSNVVLIFPESITLDQAADPITAVGWKIYKDPSLASKIAVYEVQEVNNTTLRFTNKLPQKITDVYNLAYTAIAYVNEKQPDGTRNLYLYYNYQPWKGETYKNGQKALVIDHIKDFKFQQKSDNIHIKLCAYKTAGDTNITFCSERSIQ